MKLLHLSLLVIALLAVSVECAKKKKTSNRDRDREDSRQVEDDQLPSARREEEVKLKDLRKKEKEEKPLKKAEDEESSSEEDEKEKAKENATTIAPKRSRRYLAKEGRGRRHASSEEDTLKKAEELNGGVQRPVDKQPSQSTMPEKPKSHKRRMARQLIKVNQPGNQFDSRDEEEWRIENEEDYDNGGNQ